MRIRPPTRIGMCSVHNVDAERGHLSDVTFKDTEVSRSIYNPGYCISLINGWDGARSLENVAFENFRLGSELVTDGNGLDLHTKHAVNVQFR